MKSNHLDLNRMDESKSLNTSDLAHRPKSSKIKPESTELPQVTDYLNYREYLRDFFQAKKELNPNYSHRVFMQKASLSSPGHLKMVMDSKRNLTHMTVPKYIGALGLTKKKEIKYFELLVRYNQCENPVEKIDFFNELMAERKRKGLSVPEKNQFNFLSNWLHVAIYVMTDLKDFKADPDWIASRLRKKVSKLHVEAAIEDLLELGMIAEVDGGYVQVSGAITIPDEIVTTAIHAYHENMLRLTQYALREFSVQDREFNGVTFSFKKSELHRVKNRIREFRKEINEFASNEDDPDEIYQLNIQLLPLTKETN